MKKLVLNVTLPNLGNSMYFNTLALLLLLKYKQGNGGVRQLLRIMFTSRVCASAVYPR